MLAYLCIFVFAHAYYRITDDAVLEFYSRSRSLRQDPRARNAPLIAFKPRRCCIAVSYLTRRCLQACAEKGPVLLSTSQA